MRVCQLRVSTFVVMMVFVLLNLLCLSSDSPAALQAASLAQPSSDWRTYANGDDIWALDLEGQSVVWTATRGGGVVRWDIANSTNPLPTQYLFPQDGLAGNVVRDVVVDSRNHKWFATDRGLSQLTASGQWRTYTRASTGGKLASDVVTALARQGNNLWVGTQQVYNATTRRWEGGGLTRVDISHDQPIFQETWNADTHSIEIPSNNVTDIAVDAANGDVWVTMRVDQQNVEPTPERPNQYFRARAGGITVVHTTAGFNLEMFRRGSASTAWPKYDSILTVAIDGQGIKWFGSGDLDGGGNGLYAMQGTTWDNARWKWFSSSVAISGSTLVGNMPPEANQIPHIAISPDNKVWVSLANGDPGIDHGEGLGVCRLVWDRNFDASNAPRCELNYSTTQTGATQLPGNLVRAIRFSADGSRRFFGTAGRLSSKGNADYGQGSDGYGLAMQTIDQGGTAQMRTLATAASGQTPSSNHISALTTDTTGQLWVGYAYPLALGADAWRGQGVDRLATNGQWQAIPHTTMGAMSRAVSDLVFDSQGRLWVGLLREQAINGTYVNGGVAVRDTGGVWTRYSEAEGAPSVSVSALAVEGSRLWVGSGTRSPSAHGTASLARGLGMYDLSQSAWAAPLRVPALLGDEITDLTAANGQTWVANASIRMPGATNPPGGLTSLQERTPQNHPANQGGLVLTNSDPRAILVAPDASAWAGGYYTPINEDPVLADASINWRLAGETTWTNRRFPDDGWVSAIAYRPQGGSVWVGTSRGGQNVEDFPGYVFTPNSGNRYQATGGLKVFAGGAWHELTPANSPLVSGHITALTVDAQGAVWIGTTLGLMRYTGQGPVDQRVPRIWLPLIQR